MDHLLSKEKVAGLIEFQRYKHFKTNRFSLIYLVVIDHLFSFERSDSLSSLFFENRILQNMFFLLLLREETGFSRIKQGQEIRN